MADTDFSVDSARGDGATDPFDEAYRRLVGYAGGGEDPSDPADVVAMQMVLRIEKADPPGREELLTAAARAVALLCLDDRCGADGPWAMPMDVWCKARIRKIARRARGAQWVAAQEVWGLTVTEGFAQARALVPGRVGEVDRRISRLQIGGTDLAGEVSSSADVNGVILWLNPAVTMTVGKAAAQVGHAAMLAVKLMDAAHARAWRSAGCPLSVRAATPQQYAALLDSETRGEAVAVRDAGFTEVAPGSVTVITQVTER